MKYHVLFMKGAKMKATRIKNSCIARINLWMRFNALGFIGVMLCCYIFYVIYWAVVVCSLVRWACFSVKQAIEHARHAR